MSWKKIAVAVLLVLFLLVSVNLCVLLFDDPMEAVLAQSLELGWEQEDREVLAGGYSSSFLSYTAYSRFRSRSRPEAGEIYVEVAKASPLHSWQLREYRVGNETADRQPR